MRGDFGPNRTPVPTPTHTPRPKKPVISAMPLLIEVKSSGFTGLLPKAKPVPVEVVQGTELDLSGVEKLAL